jgi:alkanesulfonate monooxygenase SsuD/methylene tetrahydromethanopterin reductase-like flavin-dependent oxidoreductase (luciferase family)
MTIVAKAGKGSLILAAAAILGVVPASAADPGKQACMADAKRLCAAEMHTLSRSRVRACLITHIDQTAPTCHDFMVKARAQALSGHKPDPSTQ